MFFKSIFDVKNHEIDEFLMFFYNFNILVLKIKINHFNIFKKKIKNTFKKYGEVKQVFC